MMTKNNIRVRWETLCLVKYVETTREYQNRPIQEDEKAIETKNQLIQHKNEIKINNQNISVDSDTKRKQRVLSIKIKLDATNKMQ